MKRSPLRRRAVGTKANLSRKLRRLWQEGVKGKCWKCGLRNATVGHHLITSRRKAYCYSIENRFNACEDCHRWIHANPAMFNLWLKNNRSDKYQWYIDHLHKPGPTMTLSRMKEKEKELESAF